MRIPLVAALVALASQLPLAAQINWVVNPANGHSYGVGPTTTSWSAGETLAVSGGGHLVTLRNAAEQAWVEANFANELGPYGLWIGFNDIAVEGHWVWVSGEAVTYTNWSPGQPDNGSSIPENAGRKQRGPEPVEVERRDRVLLQHPAHAHREGSRWLLHDLWRRLPWSWPVLAAAGRSRPERAASGESVGPAGLEPATTESQGAVNTEDTGSDPAVVSISASTVAPVADLAALVRQALAAGTPLPRDLRVDLARLLVDGRGGAGS